MDKVLVYCPLNPTPPGIHKRTLESIFALEWDGRADIVFGKHDREVITADQNERNLDITRKYNQARDLTLSNGYEALFTVEADMILPSSNALKELALNGADVAYGLYVSRHGKHPWLTMANVTEQVRGSKGLGETWEERQSMWGKVVETAGVGLGCTLIRSEVLEVIPFRVKDEWIANDWYFAIDAREKGFTQVHDCGVVCGHIDNYRVLWPDVSHGYRVTDEEKIDIEELLDMAKGKYIALTTLDMGDHFAERGEEVPLDDEVAKVLLRKRAIKPRQESGVNPVGKTTAKKKKVDPGKEPGQGVKDYGSNN